MSPVAAVTSQWTWAQIVGALVPSLIALLAAVVGLLNRKALHTPGDKNIGQLVADTSDQLVTGNNKTVGDMVTEVHGGGVNRQGGFPSTRPRAGAARGER